VKNRAAQDQPSHRRGCEDQQDRRDSFDHSSSPRLGKYFTLQSTRVQAFFSRFHMI
jgi:hypothetical protein